MGIGELLIYLHQDFHNVGLGTLLTLEAIEVCRKRGLHRIGLSVVADNKPTIRTYKKVGFGQEGTRRESYLQAIPQEA